MALRERESRRHEVDRSLDSSSLFAVVRGGSVEVRSVVEEVEPTVVIVHDQVMH